MPLHRHVAGVIQNPMRVAQGVEAGTEQDEPIGDEGSSEHGQVGGGSIEDRRERRGHRRAQPTWPPGSKLALLTYPWVGNEAFLRWLFRVSGLVGRCPRRSLTCAYACVSDCAEAHDSRAAAGRRAAMRSTLESSGAQS